MADNITRIGDFSDNAVMDTPEDALKNALSDIGKNGAFENGKKILILCLDESNGQYNISFIQAGMKMSECLALCEVGKHLFLEELGYLDGRP